MVPQSALNLSLLVSLATVDDNDLVVVGMYILVHMLQQQWYFLRSFSSNCRWILPMPHIQMASLGQPFEIAEGSEITCRQHPSRIKNSQESADQHEISPNNHRMYYLWADSIQTGIDSTVQF